ncbi:MAG: MraY family glycosyltransferase [Candidatus Margulisbacteria bacterium]|nr:MraY family glycosyltransferase [Candidatus Margulisiibacteriota bacterium]
MLQYILIFVAAFFLSLLITPLAKWIALKYNILDRPGLRKIHKNPIPLTGGEAIFIAITIALLIFSRNDPMAWKWLLFGAVFILFGLIDDAVFKLRARYKIWTHILIALCFIFFTGTQFFFFKDGWINYLLTAGFITFMTNSINMLDGMDGLVAGLSFFSAGFFALIALSGGQLGLVMFSLALMGACLGFLRYNFNPASIFLGETGATFLGFILAVLAIKLQIYELWDVALVLGVERLQFISFIIPLIILGIPIFDTYFVFVNRFVHKIKFSQPGKDHSHHRIHLMGFSQKLTVLLLYAIQLVLGAIALTMVRADIQQFFALLAIVVIFFVGFTVFLSRVKVYSSPTTE